MTNVYINTLCDTWITLSSWSVHWFLIPSNQYFFCQNNLSFMRIFKKNFCSIKKIIDIFRFMLYRYIIVSTFFFILGHWLSEKKYILYYALLCYTIFESLSMRARKHFKKANGIALIESSFLVIIRLKHFEKWTKNAETFRMNHPSHDFLSISSCSPLSLALFQSPLSPSIFLANFFILGAKCLAR